MHYVIGSGPAGIACAHALVQKGVEVTLLDTGLELAPSRRSQVAELAAAEPGQWRGPKGAFLREGMQATKEGIPLKLAYGSSFPYDSDRDSVEISLQAASTSATYARGGLSNVWGAAVLPYRDCDIADWPVRIERLAPHYRAVLGFMPLSAREDGLAEEFPLYTDRFQPLEMSRQAALLMDDMNRHDAALTQRGVRYGCARIAVAARRDGRDCAHCGLCMYGCPRSLIYCSASTLEQMQLLPNFHYVSGLRATRIEQIRDRVRIITQTSTHGAPAVFEGERVYVACGVLGTTALLLRSLDHYDKPLRAADSKYFLLPLLRFRSIPGVRAELLHTLAQIFIEINDPALSPYTIHLQTYTYNDLFDAALRASLGPLAGALSGEALISRLLLFQGYLHSSHSAHLEIELRRKGEEGVLQVTGRENPESSPLLRKLMRKLLAMSAQISAVPLVPLLRPGAPGRGFHTGGAFPMSEAPTGMESDVFGRIAGFSRIHAVDSSIFPTVPATTITFTAMANAHRIASELEQYA